MPKPLVRSTLVLLLLVTSLIPLRPAVSAPAAAPPDPSGLLQSLAAQAGGALRLSYHRGTGHISFIGSRPASPLFLAPASAAAVGAEAAAHHFLAAYGSLFGLSDPAAELTVMRTVPRDDGRASVRFQQHYQGVPVFGGELIVGLDAAHNVLSASGEALSLAGLSTKPVIDAAQAQQLAVAATALAYGVPSAGLQAGAPALWIYDPVLLRAERHSDPRLVWRLEVRPPGLGDLRELVLVDAATGKIALQFNQIHSAMNRLTYTANNGTTLPGTLQCNQANTTCNGDAHAVAAHLHAGQTYSYYLSIHSRDSIDDAGLNLISTVHYGSSYENAFWDGDQMVYGDGAGFPLADDVVAHELTHGVTQYTSGLFYYYQSGAINESFSDLWGEFLDLTNGTGTDGAGERWLIGEDVAGWSALRDMENPPAKGDPDKMTSPHFYLGDGDYPNNDNGGVHINSGINNKAAYLLADGGTFNSITVSALGLTKTAQLYYEVQTGLLTSGADYLDLYNALIQACDNLSPAVLSALDCVEVQDAVDAVEMDQEPTAGYNTEAALCPSGSPVSVLYANDLESNQTGFTSGQIVNSNRWGLFDEYARSGVNSFIGNDYPGSISDSFLALNPSLGSLPANAYLHFHHSYGFEQDNASFYDGGVLEYSTNGGSSWTDAGSLIQVNGYDGALSNSYGNPLGGRSAFAGDSHGYIATRVNLASLAGQTVRFRWRLGTDNSTADWGWWVDDVSIHTCAGVAPASTNVYLPYFTKGIPGSSWTTIVQEGFEGSFPTGLWEVADPGYDEYYWAKRNCFAFAGSYSAWAMGGGSKGSGLGCGATYTYYANSWMVYGPFSLSGATAATLTFRLRLSSELNYDGACAMASINGNNFAGDCVTGTTSGNWHPVTFDLSNVYMLGDLRGQPNVWIAIRFVSDDTIEIGDSAHVDELLLRKCTAASCPAASAAADSAASAGLVLTPTESQFIPAGSRD